MPRKKIIFISLLLMTASNVNADIDAEKAKLALIVHELETLPSLIDAGSRYFCESLFWASQPKQAAKT